MSLENKIKKNIIFSGGGTGGSVTPLLAVLEELLKDKQGGQFFFVGTAEGPEKELVVKSGLPLEFIALSGGKLRRYFSWRNIFDIFKIIAAFLKSFWILRNTQADLIITAGSFVSVPLVWAAAIKKVPVIVHQQDIRPGLANKLMAPWARVITVAFEKSLLDFGPKAVWTGNPIKNLDIYSENTAATRRQYNLKLDKPLILIIGGGTGARALNNLSIGLLPRILSRAQIIHLTGRRHSTPSSSSADHYSFEFLPQNEVLKIMAAADLVISRCGLGVLTELSALKKPAILIPMPHSHQEDNARAFSQARAALVLEQKDLSADKLLLAIEGLLDNPSQRASLSLEISRIIKRGAANNIASLIREIIA